MSKQQQARDGSIFIFVVKHISPKKIAILE